jgi:uncharacterized protein (DUF2141 family)
MKKLISFLFLGSVISAFCFTQTVNTVTIEITNVVINGGKVYLSVCSTSENFKNGKPDFIFVLEAKDTVVFQEISLPNGEYLFSVFQDANDNGELDYGFFGVPKELVGMSNYFGKGYPSKSFDKQKILVNNSTGKIHVGLYKF